ncbi:MAG: ABC transporter ATP-binding protein [Armatimonadota bacterium]|nr:ABC transporter ATP-binding protein [Armatimonadota bacterium]MDR5697559.1 ABC transporter ATP-binding protein [Armatimonadota bacterium]
MAEIHLERLRKTYGRVTAIRDLSLHIQEGEFVVFLGPSGCGKTTTLRAIAGLERLDRGRVRIGGRDVTDLPPGRRGIGMVFQSYAVFPHMRVYDNIVFGLRMHGVPAAEQRRRAQEVAELLQIGGLLDRYPAQLSGGQRQRVAVARAIVMRPDVLLMDEPLSNLDALLRLHMRAELKRLHREVRSTTVYVTHDQVEALSLGDRIAVMKDGEIVQCDTPSRIYDDPASVFVGSFIGSPPMNFLRGAVDAADGTPVVRVGDASLLVPAPYRTAVAAYRGREVLVGVRPEHIRPGDGPLAGEVMVTEPLGPHKLVTVRVGDEMLKVSVGAEDPAEPGQRVRLNPEPGRMRFMDPTTEQALPRSP